MNRLLSWAVFSVSVLCPHEIHGQTHPEPLVSIGVLDGPEELTFGLITGGGPGSCEPGVRGGAV